MGTKITANLYDLVLADCVTEYATGSAQRREDVVNRFAHEWLLGPSEARACIEAKMEEATNV